MAKIRAAEVTDFPELMSSCAASFCEGNPTHLRFEELYPDTIQPVDSCMKQWLIAEVRDRIAAGVQVVPRPMVIGGEIELSAAGLGNVFTHPEFRKKGYMGALLQTVIAIMEHRRYAVCMLGGDRLRYGNFGWENAGAVRRLSLGANMMRFDERPRVSVVELRRWRGLAADTQRMAAAYSRRATRAVRTEGEFARILERPGQVVWLCDNEADGFAYISLRDDRLVEYAGALSALDRLVRYVVSRRRTQVNVAPVEAEDELDRLLLRYAAGFSVGTVGMVRIVDLEVLLQAYSSLLTRRLRGWKSAVALEIAEVEQRVVCRGDGSQVYVQATDVDVPETVKLGLRDMARLLFGPFPPAGSFLDSEFVRRAFPLPLYWPDLSHV
ncbi:MAG: GNAT family N-acetyltransferase [Kiritimatiellaeota bacterium]|nr:GNAT family N-acetyltransferase [Kiritimatiellota bacterium]